MTNMKDLPDPFELHKQHIITLELASEDIDILIIAMAKYHKESQRPEVLKLLEFLETF